MDFARALTFPFEDEDSVTKVVLGSLLMLIGLVLWFIPIGYQVHVARKVIRGKPRPLPGLAELGEVATDGIMALIAQLIYMLPLICVSCILIIMGSILGQSTLGGLLFVCLMLCVSTMLLLYLAVAGAIMTMGIIRYAETGNFVEFVRIGSLWSDVRQHMGVLLGLLLYLLGFGLIITLLAPFSLILFVVGFFLLVFYATVVSGHLIGQAGLLIFEDESY
ncbi:MAG: DUF4013 domain-containing protein [Anaerolineae bacterium]|nr:DUF4013 domain-containing protein [Anaerolineae bacterium]